MVRADGVRIKQVILNLLSNALKYTSKGGVVIATRQEGGWLSLDVRDSGKGIPKDALDKVFEAFYQVDKQSNREDSGTGLGLAICKELVNLHGGEMRITSSVGKGTTVSFTLAARRSKSVGAKPFGSAALRAPNWTAQPALWRAAPGRWIGSSRGNRACLPCRCAW